MDETITRANCPPLVGVQDVVGEVKINVLLVDADATFSRVLRRALSRRGLSVTTSDSLQNALSRLGSASDALPDAVVMDLHLADHSGLPLIPAILAANPACRIVVLSAHVDLDTAVEAVKLGAFDVLTKPADADQIVGALGIEAAGGTTFAVDEMKLAYLRDSLRQNDGNVSATARSLNMHRRTLQRILARDSKI